MYSCIQLNVESFTITLKVSIVVFYTMLIFYDLLGILFLLPLTFLLRFVIFEVLTSNFGQVVLVSYMAVDLPYSFKSPFLNYSRTSVLIY